MQQHNVSAYLAAFCAGDHCNWYAMQGSKAMRTTEGQETVGSTFGKHHRISDQIFKNCHQSIVIPSLKASTCQTADQRSQSSPSNAPLQGDFKAVGCFSCYAEASSCRYADRKCDSIETFAPTADEAEESDADLKTNKHSTIHAKFM